MTERAASLDDATMNVGLLLESAQTHQKLAEGQLERLREHTRDLDGVVRDEIRRTLVEELRALTAEAARATEALQKIRGTGAARRRLEPRGRGSLYRRCNLHRTLDAAIGHRNRRFAHETRRTRVKSHQARTARRPYRLAPLWRCSAPLCPGGSQGAHLWRQSRLRRDRRVLICMNPVVLTAMLTSSVALGVLLFEPWRQGGREFHKRGVLIADGAPMQRRSAHRKRVALGIAHVGRRCHSAGR